MEELIKILITTVIPVVLAWVGKRINEYFKDKQKEHVVQKVVEYVEQTSKGIISEEKFDEAYKKATEWLAEKGIEISATELEILIESSVRALTNGIKGKGEKQDDKEILE